MDNGDLQHQKEGVLFINFFKELKDSLKKFYGDKVPDDRTITIMIIIIVKALVREMKKSLTKKEKAAIIALLEEAINDPSIEIINIPFRNQEQFKEFNEIVQTQLNQMIN